MTNRYDKKITRDTTGVALETGGSAVEMHAGLVVENTSTRAWLQENAFSSPEAAPHEIAKLTRYIDIYTYIYICTHEHAYMHTYTRTRTHAHI